MLDTKFSPTNPATPLDSCSENQAFFYIDGIPTKGLWVDIDNVNGWEDVSELLAVAFPDSVIDEILCADVEGLARHFYASNCDSFGMSEWVEFQEERSSCYLSDEVIDAYFDNCGVSPLGDVEDSYLGEFSSDTDFAEDYLDNTGDLAQIPENLRWYFDYEAFARDLMMDCFSSNGHYFRNC
jgi:antirestriction protein